MTASTCKVDAVVLAAGCSKRMGSNKLLLPLGQGTLLGQFLSNFPFSYFQRVIGVYSDDRVAAIFSRYPVTLCANPHPEEGKSRSIRLSIAASSGGDGVMFSVADQPLLSKTTIVKLLESFSLHREKIVVPYNGGKPANPVIFPSALLPELKRLQNDDGGKDIISKHRHLVHAVDIPEADEFVDIDTPETYCELLEKWKQKD